jgi:REP element-mobilizing transposase RayT
MARKPRLEFEGAIYHLLNRGNYRSDIFRAEKTRAAFLKCLGEACAKMGWRAHAWCIMLNHFHLALETPGANLVERVQWLQVTFSVRFNRLRKERGAFVSRALQESIGRSGRAGRTLPLYPSHTKLHSKI